MGDGIQALFVAWPVAAIRIVLNDLFQLDRKFNVNYHKDVIKRKEDKAEVRMSIIINRDLMYK